MKKIIFLLLAFLAFATHAEAALYGTAGCGLGSVIFGSGDTPGVQTFAVTTNASSGTQLFGITSGTSNCVPHKKAADKKAVREWMPEFLEANLPQFQEDVARGSGETINSIAQLSGCQSQELGHQLQSAYQEIFADTDVNHVTEVFLTVISRSQVCPSTI